jgi:Zinc dependent phospholipase C
MAVPEMSNSRSCQPSYTLIMGRFIAIVAIVLFLGFCLNVQAYSVLTHEAIIDSAWHIKIRPLLLERFPNATKDELHQAHAFAYGGAIIQDLGYYPHGSHFFSDLVHYVRSGDFILALLRDSQDLNEYAFALGALAHYAADDNGHRLAVNRTVPLLYPRLGKKYGNVVTYEDNPAAHLKTEFGFDVLQVARGRYAPDSYHDFIGFEVAKPLLERAFQDTYSLPLQSVFNDLDKAIGSYRYTVHSVIPKATKVAWALKEDEIKQDLPGMTREKFLFNLSRASYHKKWGKNYRKPGLGERFLAFLIRLTPKIGPLKALTFRVPTPQVERMFMASFNTALEDYQHLLDEQRTGHLDLPNRNFDTGSLTLPGTYFMADQTYARLLDCLTKDQFKLISAELRADILAYYSDSSAPIVTKKKAKDWARVTKELEELKSAPSRLLTSDAGPAN